VLNSSKHTELANHAWSVADLLRGDYKQSDYGKVILPFTVLRRLECVLAPTKDKVLEVAARHKTPVVIHDELNADATTALEAALSAVPSATIVLAHGGESAPAALEALLGRHRNLVVDLSGMHFQRTPALATEKGPLDPAWKALIVKHPERFVMGIDVWAARLFEPAMLDRLMTWTRRILGELPPEVAERVAHRNATALFRLE